MKISDFIGETTAYDKKVRLEEKSAEELAEKCECICQWRGWLFSFWHFGQ